jgi:hypothetical protein
MEKLAVHLLQKTASSGHFPFELGSKHELGL